MSTADLPAAHAVADKAPLVRIGALRWLRENLFNSWLNAVLTVLALGLIYLFASRFIAWGLINAVWSGPASACEGKGACWAVLGEKGRFILFGRYPYEEQYRPALFLLLFVGLVAVSTIRRVLGGPAPPCLADAPGRVLLP